VADVVPWYCSCRGQIGICWETFDVFLIARARLSAGLKGGPSWVRPKVREILADAELSYTASEPNVNQHYHIQDGRDLPK
jgi:hypothetical protein